MAELASRLTELFEDQTLVEKIRHKLPRLFQLAELEASRAGKIGMEVGSVREKILIALLIYKFGKENVETKIAITEPEIDVKLFGQPISIKTTTGLSGVKIIWTVDAQKAREFRETYIPKCDILLALIKWGSKGSLYYIPLEVQQRVFKAMGRNKYIRLPKPGTNPRGVEYEREALLNLLQARETRRIEIEWRKTEIEFDPYKRWVDYWKEE
ncbi:MAG: ThaI family type II restriction endonuclease [Thermoproteota archaeon]